jgi:FkbM family methyltransferase
MLIKKLYNFINKILFIFNLRINRISSKEVNQFENFLSENKFFSKKKKTLENDLLNYISINKKFSFSERFQDLVFDFVLKKKKLFFIEFGASDGISASNSYYFENFKNSKGILLEPCEAHHKNLLLSRKKSKIYFKCVDIKSGVKKIFFEDKFPSYSSVVRPYFRNYKKSYLVETISINDLLSENNIKFIDFLSIDTEGSEYDILRSLNFKKYKITSICVEHNFNFKKRRNIFNLLSKYNYVRLFKNFSAYDDFYFQKNIYLKLLSKYQ